MIISSVLLLPPYCCTFMLVLSLIDSSSANTNSPTPSAHNSNDDNSEWIIKKRSGVCLYNLTDSSGTVEANSSMYAGLGFVKCEYYIHAPASHTIQLNFTQFLGVRLTEMPSDYNRQHLGIEASTTTVTKSKLVTSRTTAKLSNQKNPAGTGKETSKTEEYIDSHYKSDVNKAGTFNKSHSNKGGRKYHEPSGFAHGKASDFNADKSGSDIDSTPSSLSSVSDSNRDLTQRKPSTGAATANSPHDVHFHKSSTVPQNGFSDVGQVQLGDCVFKLIIKDEDNASNSKPQVICGRSESGAWEDQVFYFSSPVRIIYQWTQESHSGFLLHFSSLPSKDCEFWCDGNRCLLKYQLCDGTKDCTDHSDEQSKICAVAKKQVKQEDGVQSKPIIVAVCLVVVIIALSMTMFFYKRRRNNASHNRDSLLHQPHSHGSEVYRSTSGSMQDGGQFDQNVALLQDNRGSSLSVLVPVPRLHPELRQTLASDGHLQEQRCSYPNHSRSSQSPPSHTPPPQSWPQQQVSKCFPSISQTGCFQFLPQQQQQQQACIQPRDSRITEQYPPHIPRSLDGEEGYKIAQMALKSKQQQQQNLQAEQIVRPPPNKTIHDRETSPPPYFLHASGAPSMLRPVRSNRPQASPTVRHCHSLSYDHQHSIDPLPSKHCMYIEDCRVKAEEKSLRYQWPHIVQHSMPSSSCHGTAKDKPSSNETVKAESSEVSLTESVEVSPNSGNVICGPMCFQHADGTAMNAPVANMSIANSCVSDSGTIDNCRGYQSSGDRQNNTVPTVVPSVLPPSTTSNNSVLTIVEEKGAGARSKVAKDCAHSEKRCSACQPATPSSLSASWSASPTSVISPPSVPSSLSSSPNLQSPLCPSPCLCGERVDDTSNSNNPYSSNNNADSMLPIQNGAAATTATLINATTNTTATTATLINATTNTTATISSLSPQTVSSDIIDSNSASSSNFSYTNLDWSNGNHSSPSPVTAADQMNRNVDLNFSGNSISSTKGGKNCTFC